MARSRSNEESTQIIHLMVQALVQQTRVPTNLVRRKLRIGKVESALWLDCIVLHLSNSSQCAGKVLSRRSLVILVSSVSIVIHPMRILYMYITLPHYAETCGREGLLMPVICYIWKPSALLYEDLCRSWWSNAQGLIRNAGKFGKILK
ncbi:hypothetical protein DFP73DRAFT_523210 [Morchella snyderi]|nr:hypothetical protein DFP73DRAFT_523210 [Morchella snyderi]